GLEVLRPAPLDLCDRLVAEAEDETILMQAGEHVAVREGRRVTEHLPALDGGVRRHDSLEEAHELRRRGLPGRTISPPRTIAPRRVSADGSRVKTQARHPTAPPIDDVSPPYEAAALPRRGSIAPTDESSDAAGRRARPGSGRGRLRILVVLLARHLRRRQLPRRRLPR